MDITNFMTWFVSQVVSIFTQVFTILDNIRFGGTTLLRVCVMIVILSALIPVFFTIGRSSGGVFRRSERVERSSKKGDSDD